MGSRSTKPEKFFFKEANQLARRQPEKLIKCQVGKDKSWADVLYPGLMYSDFDNKLDGKTGQKWSVVALSLFAMHVQYMMMYRGLFNITAVDDKRQTGYLTFVVGANFTCTNAFHAVQAATHWGPRFDIYSKVRLNHVGKSSFTTRITLFNAVSGDLLATISVTLVLVDVSTRRPMTLPDHFNKYKSDMEKCPENITIEKTEQISIPEEAIFIYTLRAAHGDTDMNGHVSGTSYVKFCFDAAAEAALSGFYSNFNKILELYSMESMVFDFFGEALRGEEITVTTWENNLQPNVLHFVIKNQKMTICTAKYTYPSEKVQSTD